MRAQDARLLREIAAEHAARHDDVGEEQPDFGMGGDEGQCLPAICRLDHAIAFLLQARDDHLPHADVVLDHQDAFLGMRL